MSKPYCCHPWRNLEMRSIRNTGTGCSKSTWEGSCVLINTYHRPSLLIAATLGWWAPPAPATQGSAAGAPGHLGRLLWRSVYVDPLSTLKLGCPVTEVGRFSLHSRPATGHGARTQFFPFCGRLSHSRLSVPPCHHACGAVFKAPVPDPRS